MLVTADWVVPVGRPPIRDGGVLIRSGKIQKVGSASEIAREYPDARLHEFPECAVIPGLVNAHTHLGLTVLADLVPPTDFADWLTRVVPAIKSLTQDDLAASATLGALECLRSGVTVVGDIVYGPEAAAAAADAGLGGAFFWEVLGIGRSELPEFLAEREFPARNPEAWSGRVRCGLSPHSIYSSGPDLIRAVHEAATIAGTPFAMHVAESVAEEQLAARGNGPLERVARRLALGYRTPRSTPVAYLDRLGALAGTIAVHCASVSRFDIQKLARRVRGVVLCPRSNAYLQNGPAPVADLDEAGIRMAVGTDSSASNADLDLFAEVRALRKLHPAIGHIRALEIMTTEGASVLGLEKTFGRLAEGMLADVVAIRIGKTDRPEQAVIELGSTETVTAVLASAEWRILGGKPVVNLAQAEREARAVAARVRGGV